MPLKDSRSRWLAVPAAAVLASAASFGVCLSNPRPVTRMPHVMSSLDNINHQTAEIMVALISEANRLPRAGGATAVGLDAAMRWENRIGGPLRVLRAAADDYDVARGDSEGAAQLREICDRLEGAVAKAFAAQGARIASMGEAPPVRTAFRSKEGVRGPYVTASLHLRRAVREAEQEGIAASEWVAARIAD